MTAFNAVRFRAKSGRDQEFLDAHRNAPRDWPGLKHVNMIKTGHRSYCIIAEWTDMEALAAARPNMIATLDSFRNTLEDLGGGLGVTDPVSGRGGAGTEVAKLSPRLLALLPRCIAAAPGGCRLAFSGTPRSGAFGAFRRARLAARRRFAHGLRRRAQGRFGRLPSAHSLLTLGHAVVPFRGANRKERRKFQA
jgi:hypothetical protein